MIAADTYVRRETAISVAINVALSLLVFLAAFGRAGPVRVWGVSGYVFDFVPQGFMIALMATLVPGALAAKELRSGKVSPLAGISALPPNLFIRAILFGTIGAGVGVAGAATILAPGGASGIAWTTALVAKLVFGGALAAIVTPIGLRAALTER